MSNYNDVQSIFRNIVKGNYRGITINGKYVELYSSIMLGCELTELIDAGFVIEDITLFEQDTQSDIVFRFRNLNMWG